MISIQHKAPLLGWQCKQPQQNKADRNMYKIRTKQEKYTQHIEYVEGENNPQIAQRFPRLTCSSSQGTIVSFTGEYLAACHSFTALLYSLTAVWLRATVVGRSPEGFRCGGAARPAPHVLRAQCAPCGRVPVNSGRTLVKKCQAPN